MWRDHTGIPARRALGAGRLDDIGDIHAIPHTVCQVANRKDLAQAVRHKPLEAETAARTGACHVRLHVPALARRRLPGRDPRTVLRPVAERSIDPLAADPDVTLYHGDCLDVLRQLPTGSVHMCATSPPFYGLRDYGTGEWEGGNPDCDHQRPSTPEKDSTSTLESRASNQNHEREPWPGGNCGKCGARRVDQQIGLEETPDQWVDRLVEVFREVRRVLRDDGTLWVEIGDSYSGSPNSGGTPGVRSNGQGTGAAGDPHRIEGQAPHKPGKPKDLLGQPWLLAFALRADGWYLRSEIIWATPNPMPESVTDRPTKCHSTVFLLSKQPRYFYDADAIREAARERPAEQTGRVRRAARWRELGTAHKADRERHRDR